MRKAEVNVHRMVFVSLLLAACGLSTGCAAGKADVAGKVSHKGKAVAMGTVVVRGPDGIEMTGAIQPDGSYLVRGVTAGAVKFGVISRDPAVVGARARAGKGRADGKEEPKGEEPPKPPPESDAKWFALPIKYESPDSSSLTTMLHGGENPYDLELP
jgi:hypothetical protein